jgi:hypothetical protein
MPPKTNRIKSSNKSLSFVRRNSPRKARHKFTYANVTENVNCSEREQNQNACENAPYEPPCVWNGEKCITEKAANKRITPMPFTGSNDTSGNADGTDNDLTNSGQANMTGQIVPDDNMTPEEADKAAADKAAEEAEAADKEAEAPKQAEAEKEVTPTGTVTVPPAQVNTPVGSPQGSPVGSPQGSPRGSPAPQEYTVSFEGTYDEEAKTFSGSLTIDGKEYTITSNPSMSSGVSSSSSPKTDDNIAAIQKMLPTIPGITFNIQEV